MKHFFSLFSRTSSSGSSRLVVAGLAAAAAVAAAPAALAQTPMVNARVLSATPVTQQVPVRACAPGGYGGTSGAGAAIGAVTGGLIGSQFGRGNGHAVGAIVGALGGAMLGNTAEAQQRGYYGGGCTTQYQNRIVGYDVAYELDGQQYQTRTVNPPGRWIQVPAPAYGYAPQGYEQPAYPDAGYAEQVPPAYPVQPAYSNGYAQPYPQPYPQAYPQAYPAPAYPQSGEVPVAAAPVAYYPAPVVAPLPVPVPVPLPLPIGLNLSFGGVFGGGHHHGGWR